MTDLLAVPTAELDAAKTAIRLTISKLDAFQLARATNESKLADWRGAYHDSFVQELAVSMGDGSDTIDQLQRLIGKLDRAISRINSRNLELILEDLFS